MRPKAPYQAYVIRLWPASRQGRAACRVLLEEVETHDRREFADLDGLFDYLRAQSDQFGTRGGAAIEAEVF